MDIQVEIISPDLHKKLQKASAMALRYYTGRVRAYADPYTPFDTGRLKNTVTEEYESNNVSYLVYHVPYARYVWYGKDDWNWHNGGMQVGGLRGHHWVTRMYADKGQQIEREVKKYLTLEMNK